MICTKCSTDREQEDFSRDKTVKSGYRKHCKICNREKQRLARKENPERFKQYDRSKQLVLAGKKPRKKNLGIDSDYKFKRKFLDKIKQGRGCSLCEENHPKCLSFHHVDPKQKLFTVGYITGKSLQMLKEEIRKCVVLCENCHRKQHAKTRDRSKLPKYKITKFQELEKHKKMCILCSETEVSCLDFHHTDTAKKKFTIGENINLYTIDELLQEVAICVVVCANCHRKYLH